MILVRPHPQGLVLSVVTIGAAAGAFTILADSVSEGDGLAGRDPSITADVVDHRTSVLTHVAHVLSFIGSEAVLAVLALGLVIILLERRGPRHAIIAATTMAVSAGLTVAVKLAFGRARPGASDRLGPFDSTYSFPSGHTLNSAVFLGLVCLLLVPLLRRPSLRLVAYGAAAMLAVGIGASRIYLGYHWTTDVAASWTIAAVLLAVVSVTARAVADRSHQSGNVQVDRATVDS
ncbi:phosphatase PAP2 family protein [Aeromicrobium stalagmiti]|uniref:phosphatase PAP2 family protein n=1 Tax=Aeromicrobium stalagmiti TaxID=2738988 RepID=UPI00156858C7|nr:phosphatase PAP2 family protein [Aeromicrobium stalagmiti]NRQ51089.1 phosphatase PAP2 family protein [Aeromicrobium stalagmiti]